GTAAAHGHARLAAADLLVALHTLELLARDERAHLGLAFDPRPQADALGLLDHRVQHLLVDGPLHEHAAARRADLALVDEHAEERAVHRGLEIGVSEEDVGRLAAQLQADLLERVG